MNAVTRLMTDSRTYLRIFYLVAAFPLATFYFVVVITGISVGMGTAIIIIGFPILLLTLLAAIAFGRLERLLAIHLLGAKIGPSSMPEPAALTLTKRLQRLLADPVTWKSLVYVLLEFPFAIVSFTLVIALLSTSLSLLITPIAYVVVALFDPAALQNGIMPGLSSPIRRPASCWPC